MGNRIRVYTELLDFSSCFAVIRSISRIGEKKLRFARGRVLFIRDHNNAKSISASMRIRRQRWLAGFSAR
jgi:hypothetical protein